MFRNTYCLEWYFSGWFHNSLLQTLGRFCSLISVLCNWFHLNIILTIKNVFLKKYLIDLKRQKEVSGLDGKGLQSQSHAPAHVILKAHVWYVACLQHCTMCLPIDYWFIQFLHFLLLSFKCSVRLYQLFINFTFSWSFFFICVPVTNNHLNAL